MIERRSIQNRHQKNDTKANPGDNSSRIRRNPAVFLAFIITAILLTLLFVILGFYPFGVHSVIISDLGAQYAPDLVAYKNLFLAGEIHTYSSLIGMGKNVFGLFAYYLSSPINFVTFLFPTTMISEAVLVLITIKLSLAALFMTLFLRRRFHTDSGFAVAFGIVYATCSYAMVYMINIMWLDGFFLLPLLLFFIEQFLENRKYWWRVALTLFVLFVSGFYIAYMVGIFSFLYILVRLFEEKGNANERNGSLSNGPANEPGYELSGNPGRKAGKTIGLFIGSAVLAAGMSAAVLIPAGMDILGNPDKSANTLALDSKFTFVSFLNQLLTGSFDSLSNNKPLVYCGLAVLFLCILFFLNPYFSRRQKAVAGTAIGFMIFSFNFSFLDLAWQLFDKPNWFKYRYSFLLVLVVLLIAFASILHVKSLRPKAFIITGLLFLLLLLVVQGFGDLAKEGDRFYINLLMGGMELMCIYAMTGVTFPASIANLKRLVPAFFVILICVEVIFINPLYMRPKMFGGESKREPFVAAMSQTENLVQDAKEDAKLENVLFYRMETDDVLDGIESMTAGLYLNYPSISTFTSSSNKDLNRLLKQLGYNTNYNYFSSTHTYSSVVTDSLLGIRYILSEKANPGGYDLLSTSSDGTIFMQKNSQALPLLYLVSPSAADFDFFSLEKNPENKNLFVFQDKLLVSLFGEAAFAEPVYYEAQAEPPVIYNAVIREAMPTPVVTPGSTDTADAESDAQSLVKDTDLLGEEPVGKKLDFSTTYLRMSEQDVLSLTYSVIITGTDPLFVSFPAVTVNDQADVYVNGTFVSELSSSMYSQIISLGTFEPGETVTVQIRADVNSYSIIPALFYYCDTALFEKELAAAVKTQDVQISKAEDGYVSAQVTVSEDKLLLTTIPYEKGWTLLVDGVKTEITPYQKALISIPLAKGQHTITLSFTPPGMWAGAAVTGAASLIFAAAVILTYRKRSKPV